MISPWWRVCPKYPEVVKLDSSHAWAHRHRHVSTSIHEADRLVWASLHKEGLSRVDAAGLVALAAPLTRFSFVRVGDVFREAASG